MKSEIESNSAPLARIEELVVQELPDEVLVYDLRQHKAHCLNRTAAFVWNRCDGHSTPDEIAKLIEQEWHSPFSTDAVWYALNQLSKADLLQQKITMPKASASISRRSAIRRLGVGALLIPAVISIVAPTAMAGSSIPPPCTACVKLNMSGGTLGCPQVCVDTGTVGSCFSNDGCGAGNFITNATCFNCFQNLAGKSWTAP
jgi:hypothetical protein